VIFAVHIVLPLIEWLKEFVHLAVSFIILIPRVG